MRKPAPRLWSNGSQDEVIFARDLNYNPSLYIRKAFIVYLTAFFKDNPRLGYRVYDERDEIDKKHASLLVTGVYNMTLPDKGKLPAIFVERGPIESSATSGAARYAGQGRGEGSEMYETLLSTTVINHCLASDDEEADRLANLVRVGVELDYRYFRESFGIAVQAAKVDHVQIMRTGPDVYRSSVIVPVMLEVAFDIMRPKGATLREVEVYVNGKYTATVV